MLRSRQGSIQKPDQNHVQNQFQDYNKVETKMLTRPKTKTETNFKDHSNLKQRQNQTQSREQGETSQKTITGKLCEFDMGKNIAF